MGHNLGQNLDQDLSQNLSRNLGLNCGLIFFVEQGLCEDGWEPGLDYKCYKFVTQRKTWDEARADCESTTDGDLVIIETQEEHSYLVNRTLGGDWWIGEPL